MVDAGVGIGVIFALEGALELFPEWNDHRDGIDVMLVRVRGRQSLEKILGDGMSFMPFICVFAGSELCTRVLGVRMLESLAVESLPMVLLLWRDSSASIAVCPFSSASRLCFSSRSVRTVSPNSFCRLARRSSYDSVKVLEIVDMVSEVLFDGFQSMGQRTPCLATA